MEFENDSDKLVKTVNKLLFNLQRQDEIRECRLALHQREINEGLGRLKAGNAQIAKNLDRLEGRAPD